MYLVLTKIVPIETEQRIMSEKPKSPINNVEYLSYKTDSTPSMTSYNCSQIGQVTNEFVTTKLGFSMFIHPIEEDIWVSGSIKNQGVWEYSQANQLESLLSEYPNSVLVDIGANIGMMTNIALSRNRQVIAFEPLKKNFKLICATANTNGWNSKLTLYNKALGSKNGIVSFNLNNDNQGGTSVFEKNTQGVENVDFAEEKTLDSFDIAGKEILLKIDIEGFECNLFNGVEEFFSKNKVQFIWIEWVTMKDTLGCEEKISGFLEERGFKAYKASDGQPVQVLVLNNQQTFSYLYRILYGKKVF